MSNLEKLFSIRGRTALVTGGTAGIGEMIARAYVEAGARVLIASRKADQCEAVAAELSKIGSCTGLPADLATEEGCRDLAARVTELAPKLDILVNNAGATWGAPIEEFPAKGWDRALDLNLKAPFYLVQSLLPALSAAGSKDAPARVINVGSGDGLVVPVTETYSYAASKAGLHHLTRVLAKNLAARHITVNALVPGPFPSRMMKQMLETRGDEIAAMSPLGRVGRPDDMAAAAIYLASPGAAWTTGVLLPVDGGINGALSPS
ncbi:MAG: SDR family oxidoreductase [Candidatus Binatia bacterium]|nr:SDR family oxidoreductase [Candidatus Binatia bacterium]